MGIIWISHRGYHVNAVENTLPAFQAAVAQGFRVLETDLRLSADGHIVLHHDPNLQRLGGVAKQIASMPRAELEKVRLAGDSRLLFLDDFAREFHPYQWIFDVKPESAVATLGRLNDWWRSGRLPRDWLATTRFVLWRRSHEAALRRLWPNAVAFAREPACWRAGLSVIAGVPGLGGIEAGRTYALPPRLGRIELYTAKIVGAFHRRGARVLAFLPASSTDAGAAVAAGADEVLTNGPYPSSLA